MNLFSRLKTWWLGGGFIPLTSPLSPLTSKGSEFPFNRISDGFGSVVGGQKLTQPYLQSAPVMRAIKLISQPLAEVPLRFSQDSRDGKQLLQNPALMSWWESPAVGADKQPMSLADFIEASVGWLKLAGEAFWIIDDRIKANLPFQEAGLTFPRLLVARPDRMRPLKYSKDGSLLGWEFTDSNGQHFKFELAQVIHLRLWNPYDDIRGASEVNAINVDAESDYLAATFKRNLWRGNGDRGPIISVKNATTLDDAQRDQLIQQFREKRELASRGIFKAAVIGGDISVEDPRAQTVDASFVASRAEDITRIFLGLGVPPSMATVTASYSIGAASDWYRLIIDTCKPTGKKLTEGIERVLLLQQAARLFAWFDWRVHPVMQQVRKESVDSGTKLWDRGMPWEQISDWLGLDLPEFAGADVGYLPFSVVPVGADGLATEPAPEDDAAFNEPADEQPEDGSDAAGKLQQLFQQRGGAGLRPVVTGPDAFPCCGPSGEATIALKGRSPKEIALWKTHMAKRRASQKRFEAAFNKHLIVARAQVLGHLSAKLTKSILRVSASPRLPLSPAPAPAARAAAADFMFDLGTFENGLLASMRRASTLALQEAGQQFFAEVNQDDPFRYPPAKAVEFLNDRENKLKDAPQDVFDRIKAELQTGLDAGESIEKLSDRVRAEFNEISKGAARRIAMTETVAAYGASRQEAMEQSGVEYKQWLTSGAPNVRATHAAANGQTVRVDENFEVGGESLSGPGDPSGSAANVINCHCVAIAVAKPEKET